MAMLDADCDLEPRRMPDRLAEAAQILADTIVVDTLGGAVVHPTPHVTSGTYEENLVRCGFSALHVTLVSEPSYTPTWEQVQHALYENLLQFRDEPEAAPRRARGGPVRGEAQRTARRDPGHPESELHRPRARAPAPAAQARTALAAAHLHGAQPSGRRLPRAGEPRTHALRHAGDPGMQPAGHPRRLRARRHPHDAGRDRGVGEARSSSRIRPSARSPTTRAASPTSR